MSVKQHQTVRVDVDVDLMKFVLGYNQTNLKELRERFPSLKINNGKRAIYIEGSGIAMIDNCKIALDNMIVKAIADRANLSYKKRVEKEINCKRRAISAANRIRDNIETELKTKQIDELTTRISDKIGVVMPENAEYKINCGRFAGLEIDDSGDES